jgi:hypothetical protein
LTDGPVEARIVAFVKAVKEPGCPEFVAPADRRALSAGTSAGARWPGLATRTATCGCCSG